MCRWWMTDDGAASTGDELADFGRAVSAVDHGGAFAPVWPVARWLPQLDRPALAIERSSGGDGPLRVVSMGPLPAAGFRR